MSKLTGFTKRITAMLLSGMLVIGSVPGSVFAASTDVDPGQTSESAEEVFAEETLEVPADTAEGISEAVEEAIAEENQANTSEEQVAVEEVFTEEELVDTSAIQEDSNFPIEDVSSDALKSDESYFEETPLDVSREETIQYYTVTLDANGGFFENEWDDSIGDYVQQAEVVEKHIPVEGTVAAFPVFTDQDGQTMFFAGWSPKRDGELVSPAEEEYIPVDNCALYAVWQAADESNADVDAGLENMEQETEIAEELEAGYEGSEHEMEAAEETESAQEYEDDKAVEEAEYAEAEVAGYRDDKAEPFHDFEEANTVDQEQEPQEYEETKITEETDVELDEYTIPKTEDEQTSAFAQEEINSSGKEVETIEESSDISAAERETDITLIESLEEKETTKENAVNGVVESGSWGGITWTLNEEGILTISGTGEISKYDPYCCDFSKYPIRVVIIEDGVTTLGYGAFSGCTNLTSVSIPNSVTAIGGSAFGFCKNLQRLNIPDSVTSIGDSAFYDCEKLTSVTIPNSVKSIGEGAFFDCECLTDLNIPDSVTRIGDGAFDHCSSLSSITIPDGVESIGHRTFRSCSSLTNITIPDSITSIGERAFEDCSGLTNITIPDSTTSIGYRSFKCCDGLTSITIPDSTTIIGIEAFLYCTNLTILGSSNSAAYRYAIENKIPFIPTDTNQFPILVQSTSDSGLNWSLDSAYNLHISGNGEIPDNGGQSECPWIEYSKTIRSIILDSGITYIGAGAFYEYENLSEFTSKGAEIIGQQAFFGCIKLKEVSLPNTLKRINDWAFYNCRSISSITIPDSVTHISRCVFYGCDGLENITLSNKTSSIGSDAFSGCSNLKGITLPQGINYIETNTFRSCSELTNITIPEGVLQIGSNAFYECNKLSNVFIPSTVEDIGYCVFHYYNRRTAQYEPIPGLTISGYSGTYAESYAKEQNIPFKSLSTSISAAGITVTNQTYTGEDLKPAVTVKMGSTTLKANTDYIVEYSNNLNAGTATVTVTGKIKYKGTKTATFKINKATQSITASNLSLIYPRTGIIKASSNQGKLTYKSSSTAVAAVDSSGKVTTKGVGTANITITAAATDNYNSATKIITVTVTKGTQSIAASNLSLTFPNSGQITVSGNNGALSYKSSNTAVATVNSTGKVTATGAGTAKITITAAATSNYNVASKTITVTVAKGAQSITAKAGASSVAVGKTTTVSITGAKGTKSYKSSDTTIATVTSAGKVTAKKVGTVKITTTSAVTSNYNAASKTATIKVVPAATASLAAANQATGIKLTWKKVTGANGYKIYRGSTLVKTIASGSTVTYADTSANTNGTKYTYKIVAKASTGDSTLSKSVTTYRVARPAISSVTNSAASKMTVKWGKNAKATGYQIQYSTSRSFASGNKTANITGASTVSKLIGSLTKGKTYYVRIRTYKTVGSKKFWSTWSAAKSVKISK